MMASASPEASARAVAWPNCVNARDLGGLPAAGGVTRRGWLYRSDTLTRLTAAGHAAIRRAGVSTVIDLRDEPLRRRDPHSFAAAGGEGPRVFALPLLPDDFPFPLPLADGYVRALDAALDRVGPIVREIVEAPGAVVFHCHSGTGRTGMLAALLLAFAGVAADLIADDYLVSLRAEEEPAEARHVVPGLLAHLARCYGGPDDYLGRAGVEADLRKRLRTRLVDRSASRPSA